MGFKNVFVFCDSVKTACKPGEDRLLGHVDFGFLWSLCQLVTWVAAMSPLAVN